LTLRERVGAGLQDLEAGTQQFLHFLLAQVVATKPYPNWVRTSVIGAYPGRIEASLAQALFEVLEGDRGLLFAGAIRVR
jgi:hypothetical protein